VEIIKKDVAKEKKGGEDKTVEWRMYSDKNLGFEMQYPAKFNVASTVSGVDIREEIGGRNFDAYGVVSKGEYALEVVGIWSPLPLAGATAQKKLFSENKSINGVEFSKDYWAIRTAGTGNWLTALIYYGCVGGNCFSLMKGIEVTDIDDGIEASGQNAFGKDIVSQTVIGNIKEKMDNSQDEDVLLFNQMVLTFKFVQQ
jgi:hypothetical protein